MFLFIFNLKSADIYRCHKKLQNLTRRPKLIIGSHLKTMSLTGGDRTCDPQSEDEGYSCSQTSCHESSCKDVAGEGDLDFEKHKRDYCSLGEINSPNEALQKKAESNICHAEGEVIEETVDVEEGEIHDASSSESLDKYTCRYYRKGKCTRGKDCPFFHLSDKGLYKMFDYPTANPETIYSGPNFGLEPEYFPPDSIEETETNWDRALKEATKRVKESRKRLALLKVDKLCMTIRKDKCIIDKSTCPESSRRSRNSRSPVRRARDFSRSRKEPRHTVPAFKRKFARRDYTSTSNYLLNCRDPWRRSKTPPMSKQKLFRSAFNCFRSRSSSRSSLEQSPCRCCRSQSPEHVRYEPSFHIIRNRQRRSSTSSGSSCSCTISKKVSKRKRRGSRSRRASSKAVKSLRNAADIDSSAGAKRVARCRYSSPKKLASPLPTSCNRSCSDMSISPLSQEKDRLTGYSSNRRLSDMSISPLSDASCPDGFLQQTEKIVPEISKASVGKLSVDVIPKGSTSQEFIKSSGSNNSSEGRFLCASTSASNPETRSQTKKQASKSLLQDLMKFHRNLKFTEVSKTVSPEASVTTASSNIDDEKAKNLNVHYQHEAMVKEERQNPRRSNLSKKQILSKRLQEIEAAIARRKLRTLQKT